jgi:hypothetical protein
MRAALRHAAHVGDAPYARAADEGGELDLACSAVSEGKNAHVQLGG